MGGGNGAYRDFIGVVLAGVALAEFDSPSGILRLDELAKSVLVVTEKYNNFNDGVARRVVRDRSER